MALNIPMPGQPGEAFLSGLDTGSAMFQRMMQPYLEQQRMAQQAHQFAQDLALRRESAGRASAAAERQARLFPLQQRQAELQLAAAERAADPQKMMDYFKQVHESLGGNITDADKPIYTPLGKMSIPEAQMMLMSGIEIPGVQKQLESILKDAPGGGLALTTPSQTKLQNIMTGVDSALPILEELVKEETKIPTGLEWFSPEAYATYHSKVNSIIEPLIGAMGLNVTDATKQMMKDQVERKTRESTDAYKKRLQDFIEDIKRRRKYAAGTLEKGSIDFSPVTGMSTEELLKVFKEG